MGTLLSDVNNSVYCREGDIKSAANNLFRKARLGYKCVTVNRIMKTNVQYIYSAALFISFKQIFTICCSFMQYFYTIVLSLCVPVC